MKPIATFDLETDPFKCNRSPLPFAADFYDGKTHRTFWGDNCVAECFAVMRKFEGYIYAHNGGKFDFKYLLPLLPIEDLKVHRIGGRIAKIVMPNGKTEFRDSYCILPVPQIKFGKTGIDYTKMEADVRTAHRAEIIRYLKDDTESLFRAVEEFISEYGFGLTIAGRTFDQLKKRFDIQPPKTNQFYDKKYRKYYYGGRVEFFELGKLRGRFKIFDINSAYPAAMKSEHAFGTDFLSVSVLPSNAKILSTCFISFIGESRGGLPWKDDEGALSFKPHRGEFHVTGWELVTARKLNLVRIEKVIACHRPLSCKDFSAFVDYFYKQKKMAEKGSREELRAKLMLNSCYGRFALQPLNYRETKLTDYGEEPEENGQAEIEGEEKPWRLVNDFEDIGISVWEKDTPLRADSYFNVATAASITGKVRAFLMESLAAVRRPVYCDTDCIICEDPGNLKIGVELGEWKNEGETECLNIAGKKLYAARLADGKWKCASKGVRISPADIVKIAGGEEIKSTLEAPSFSLVSGERFITRTVRRDDKRKRRMKLSDCQKNS